MYTFNYIILTILLYGFTVGQENAQFQLSPSLRECYENPALLDKDSRLPMTMPVLIDILRKIENYPTFNMDMRQFSSSILHRFRQDGISRASGSKTNIPGIIPYSPTGFQFKKHRILLKYMIPGNAQRFDNNSLTAVERCTLHFMLSDSHELQIRGNEGQVCRLGYYRRIRREAESLEEDIEILKNSKQDRYGRRGLLQSPSLNPDAEVDVIQPRGDNNQISQCPVENGVVYTRWGSVTAGALVAGIAAGLAPQEIQTRDIDKNVGGGSIDNKWAATFAGDIAEVALIQGEKQYLQEISKLEVGVGGSWNNSQVPKWYFLRRNDNLELTDGELRGDLDGLILGSNVQKWARDISSLKLSQLLDMYYSKRGVFTEKIRACNRNILFTEYAPTEKIEDQSRVATQLFQPQILMRITVNGSQLEAWSNKAVRAVQEYIPTLQDITCTASEFTLNNQVVTDITIIVDTAWPYKDIEAILAYLIENIDINIYGTNVTIVSAKDPRVVLVNGTQSLLGFYSVFNETTYTNYIQGLDLIYIYDELLITSANKLNLEKKMNLAGGRSQIALILPYTSVSYDKEIAEGRLTRLREDVPDLKVLYASNGNKEQFNELVEDKRDTFTVSPGQDIAASLRPLIERIKQIQRRVTYSECGSDWESDREDGGNTLVQYVQPGDINYYQLRANYFFRKRDQRRVKIQGNNYLKLKMCYSRQEELPREDNKIPNSDIKCEEISAGTKEIMIEDMCSDHKRIMDCPSLYFSVEAPISTMQPSYQCHEKACRYPDSIRFSIITERMTCDNGAATIILNILLLSLVLVHFM